jgi:hypothetical protein
MMFGRKKKNVGQDQPDGAGQSGQQDVWAETEDDFATSSGEDASVQGPRDRSQVARVDHLVDLGSVHALPGPGMELRLELDSATQEVSAIQLANDDGAVQIQVFAAPRTSGIWDEIRGEIAEMIPGSGGTVEEADGPFGPELRTRLAQSGPQGRTVFAPVVFAGVDGPRWFLRAVYSGAPAIDEGARKAFDECVRTIVVTRGDEPRAPREMLPLKMPMNTRGATDGAPTEATSGDDLKPFERGPEISEVR